MTDSHRCPQCDAEIPPNSPAGLCPRCLLLAANESRSVEVSGPELTKLSPPNSGFVPPTVEELAPLFPQLEILELLGKGGMGAVYKARQPGLDRLVALKILPAEISHDPKFTERFQREARALAKLNHPHIVIVYDFGQSGALCYIVMEFVDGANLRQAIRTRTFTAAEALAIVPQICEALQFAHDEGIVHRDIKPENILIDKRGRVKIADFGLAKLLGQDGSEHSLTATHQVMGTLRYMAPEQMQGSREVDHRADIYSLGVVFYELLTGELPMGKFAPPSKKVQIDVRLDEVVLRTLEQEPEQRYQHASEVKTDIETISHTTGVSSIRDLPGRTGVTRGEGSSLSNHPARVLSPQIRRQLFGPALCLMVFAIVIFLVALPIFTHGFDAVDGNDRISPLVGWMLVGLSFLVMGVAGLVLRGGWHMLSVDSYRAALLGSFLGQPVGLWGLFVLSQPDVKAAFASVRSSEKRGIRLSRFALWGAIWGGLGLIANTILLTDFAMTSVDQVTMTSVADGVSTVPVSPHADMPRPFMIFLIPLALLAVSAPLGTTIVGAAAIGNIKSSNGKLYGLRLAQADVLLYPLLLLAGIAVAAGFLIVQVVLKEVEIPSPGRDILIAVVALALWFFAARALWRFVVSEKTEANPDASVGAAPASGTPLTQIRFTVSDTQDIGRQAIFHFSSLGYRLLEQQPDVLVFTRGGKWSGLWATHIRDVLTRLTVRSTPGIAGSMWVSCDWSCQTFGAWVTRRDLANLESEGHGLETLLGGTSSSDAMPVNDHPSPAESSGGILNRLFTGTGVAVGLLSIIGPVLLLLGWAALFNDGTKTQITTPDTVPRLGTITSGIGAEFTVPRGQVATFEVVTRRDNETVPVPPHCGYVMAPPDKDIRGTFRWSRKPQESGQVWSLEIISENGRGYTEAELTPEALNSTVGAMSLGLGSLTTNEEVIHWGSADANNLPANGLIGLRVTVVPHGMQSSGSGNAHLDWKKAQSMKSTSRRKLPAAAQDQ